MFNICVWQERADGVMVRAGFLDRQHLSQCFCGCVPLLVCSCGGGKVSGEQGGHIERREDFSHHEGKSSIINSIKKFFLLNKILALLKGNPSGENTLKDSV